MKKRIGVDEDAKWFKIIDLDTKKEIKNCIGADDETGWYEIYSAKEWDLNTEIKKGNIKLVDMRLKESTNGKEQG